MSVFFSFFLYSFFSSILVYKIIQGHTEYMLREKYNST